MKQDLELLQHRLSREFGLPTVPEFSPANLLLLSHSYASKLLEISEQSNCGMSPQFQQPHLEQAAEQKSSRERLRTFWSKSDDMEVSEVNVDREMTLNWQEIYEVLEDAFGDHEEQRKGCELLETLDYRVSWKAGSKELAPRLIHWLQQANRYKDSQMKSIYYRMLNLSFEDSKDDQTFPTFVSLVHTEIESIFEMRNNYIKTIEQLNSQITDLIAETTKKEIQNGSRQKQPLQQITNYENTPYKTHNSEQKRYRLIEERKSLERSVEDMLAELLALKSDNEDLRGRLFEKDKQLKTHLMKQELKQSQFKTDTSLHKDKALIHSIERQFSRQLSFMAALTCDSTFRKSVANLRCQVEQDEDILNLLTTVNEELQSLLERVEPTESQTQASHPLQAQMNSVVKALDKLVVSEGKQGKDIENIQKLFVEIRILEATLGSELKTELIAPKLMGSIARLQKAIGKADRKLQAVLEMEKTFLLELLGQLVPTDRAYSNQSIKDDSGEANKILEGENHTLKAELEKYKKLSREHQQKILNYEKNRDQLAQTLVDTSKRITQVEKEYNELVREKGDLLLEIRKLKQSLKQEKDKNNSSEQLLKQIQSKDNDIYKLSQHIKDLETQIEQQRKHFNFERGRLAEQIQFTGSRLQDIQRLAERKLTFGEKRQQRQRQRGAHSIRKKAS